MVLSQLPALAKPQAEIPFEFPDGVICLNVKAASASRPLRFVPDSGVGISALNLDTARGLKLKLGEPERVSGVKHGADARWVHGFAARVGDVPLIADLLAFDLRQVNPAAAQNIDGVMMGGFSQLKAIWRGTRKSAWRGMLAALLMATLLADGCAYNTAHGRRAIRPYYTDNWPYYSYYGGYYPYYYPYYGLAGGILVRHGGHFGGRHDKHFADGHGGGHFRGHHGGGHHGGGDHGGGRHSGAHH